MLGRIRQARREVIELDVAAADGELLEGFVALGRRPPAFALLNRFAWGSPDTWSDGTVSMVNRIDSLGMDEAIRPVMRLLIGLDRDPDDLEAVFAAEFEVTHLFTAVCLYRGIEALASSDLDEAKWSAVAPLLVPDMHIVQSAVADEVRREFQEVEASIRRLGFRKKGEPWRTNYSDTVLAGLNTLEEQCWPAVRSRLADGPERR